MPILLSGTVQALGEFGSQEPGVAEGIGTSFQITDSDYLNIKLETSHEVMAIIQSSNGIVDLYIHPRFEEIVAFTISGFNPNKAYYKYVNTYSSGVEITTDDSGALDFVQSIEDGVHIYFKESPSTIFVSEEGWSDPSVGDWNANTLTATLTTDLFDIIEVTFDGIILDGAGHTVEGSIVLTGRKNVTVKNFVITGNYHGVELHQANSNNVQDNDISAARGVHIWQGGNNIIKGNIFSDCRTGIFISIYTSTNQILDNTFTNCLYGLQYLAWSFNSTVDGNLFLENTEAINMFGSDSNTIQNNDFINNETGLGLICNEPYPDGSPRGYTPDNNTINNNNFIANTSHAYVCGFNNRLNLDLPDGGNYWSDWITPDDNSDGVVDLPYEITDTWNRFTFYDNLSWTSADGWMNQAPAFDPVGPQEVIEYSTLAFIVSAIDPNSDEVFLSIEGLPEGASFDLATGEFTWMPLGDQAGVYVVSFSATDDHVPPKTGFLDVVITVGEIESPTDLTDTITEIIVADEVMPEAVENSYLANLKKVNDFIENGKVKAAVNQLKAFIHKTEQDVEHEIISAEDGALYIMMAQDTIYLLTGA